MFINKINTLLAAALLGLAVQAQSQITYQSMSVPQSSAGANVVGNINTTSEPNFSLKTAGQSSSVASDPSLVSGEQYATDWRTSFVEDSPLSVTWQIFKGLDGDWVGGHPLSVSDASNDIAVIRLQIFVPVGLGNITISDIRFGIFTLSGLVGQEVNPPDFSTGATGYAGLQFNFPQLQSGQAMFLSFNTQLNGQSVNGSMNRRTSSDPLPPGFAIDISAYPVPEPSPTALVALSGGVVVALRSCRRRRTKQV